MRTIDAYIKTFPKNVATRLRTIRRIVQRVAPGAKEGISYGMPAYRLNGTLLYFAAHPRHIGVYPYPSAMKAFRKQLARYKTGKSTIQLPHDTPLPVALLGAIVKFRVKENLAKNKKR